MCVDPGINLLHQIPCNIFCFTNDGKICYANAQLLQLLNYTTEEFIGLHVEKILNLSSRIFFQTHFFPLLTLKGSVEEVFLTLVGKDNTTFPVLVNANQISNNKIVQSNCACIIVRQRKKYEDEILQAKKVAEDALQKNELLLKAQYQLEESKQELDRQMTQLRHTNKELLQLNDIVAHDLQEPVRKISLYVDMVQSEWFEYTGKETSLSIEIIIKSAIRIRKVLQNLQEFMQILTAEIKKEIVNLDVLVKEQISILKQQNPAIEFETSIHSLPFINADKVQLKILFNEVLKNCVEFRSTERNLTINITASIIEENFYSSTEGKYKWVDFARITVEDNGVGFNPAYKELIFKILKKLDFERPGLGFGLAFCNRIAENHGGFMTALGEEKKGAKFTIFLPVEDINSKND